MLTDEEAHERLVAAREALGTEAGQSVHANTALDAARRAILMFQFALVAAMERASRDDGPPPDPR